jgi:hypothetical protein
LEIQTDKQLLKDLEAKYEKLVTDEEYRNEQLSRLRKQLELIENDPSYVSPEIEKLEEQLRQTGQLPVNTIVFVESTNGKALAGRVKSCTESEMTVGFVKYADVVFKTDEIPQKEIHVWIDQGVDIEFVQSIFDDQPENMDIDF